MVVLELTSPEIVPILGTKTSCLDNNATWIAPSVLHDGTFLVLDEYENHEKVFVS